MVGNQTFDIIILEFSPFSAGTFHRHFQRLVWRVRAQNPSAILIYLLIVAPLDDVLYQNDALLKYALSLNISSPRHPDFAPAIRKIAHKLERNPDHVASVYNQTIHEAGGTMVVAPSVYQDLQDHVLKHVPLYGGSDVVPWDFIHPNVLGQQHIAERLRQHIQAILLQQKQTTVSNAPGVMKHRGSGQDVCASWFLNQNELAKHDALVKVRDNMHMTRFPAGKKAAWERGQKFALEVDRSGGTLSVKCSKLFRPCDIYLSYMAMDGRAYPRVNIAVTIESNGTAVELTTVFVDPHMDQFHLRQIAYVGTINGTTAANVTIVPIPEDANSTRGRFRVTGVILTPSNVIL